MSKQYHFAYSISKEEPRSTNGFTHEEAFEALRRALATQGEKAFNMGEEGLVYKAEGGKYAGNIYWITPQE